MNSNERVRIINSGSTTLPRHGFEALKPEGEYKSCRMGGKKQHMRNQKKHLEKKKSRGHAAKNFKPETS